MLPYLGSKSKTLKAVVQKAIFEKCQEVMEDEPMEDLIQMIMCIAEEKDGHNKESLTDDMMEVIENQDHVNQLILWFEKSLPGLIEELEGELKEEKIEQANAAEKKAADEKHSSELKAKKQQKEIVEQKKKQHSVKQLAKTEQRNTSANHSYEHKKKVIFLQKRKPIKQRVFNQDRQQKKKRSILDRIKPSRKTIKLPIEQRIHKVGHQKSSHTHKSGKSSQKKEIFTKSYIQKHPNHQKYNEFEPKTKAPYKKTYPQSQYPPQFPPKKKEVSITDDLQKAMGESKIPRRCRFFPTCKDEECRFVHPTVECPKFPNCMFGESCLYIHPNKGNNNESFKQIETSGKSGVPCKFGNRCTRAGCWFTHPSGRKIRGEMPSRYTSSDTTYRFKQKAEEGDKKQNDDGEVLEGGNIFGNNTQDNDNIVGELQA